MVSLELSFYHCTIRQVDNVVAETKAQYYSIFKVNKRFLNLAILQASIQRIEQLTFRKGIRIKVGRGKITVED